MADQPIKSEEIISPDLFVDAIKHADELIFKLKELQVQQVQNITVSKEYIASFKGGDSKALKDLNAQTVKVNATLKEYEQTQLGLIEIEKKQAQLKAELAKTSREELKLTKDLAKEEANRQKALNANNGEYSKASRELAKLKRELQDMIIAEKQNTKEFKELNKQFEDLDKKVRKADASVGNFQRNVGNYPAQLKAMQRELQNLQPGTEQFNQLAARAGEVRDRINDAREATSAFATGAKTTQAKNIFGQVGDDLSDLDFEGAAEKAETFSSIVKSISFAEITSGLKSFGSAILDVGKSLLLNPFTAIAAGIAGIVYTTYDLITTFSKLAETTKTVNEALSESQNRIDELGKRQIDYLIKAKVALGELSKEQAEYVKLELKNQNERKENTKRFSDDIIKLAKELEVDLSELQGKRFNENDVAVTITGKKELEKRKAFNRELRKLEQQYLTEQLLLNKTQIAEKTALLEEEKSEKKQKEKEERDKLSKEQIAIYKKEKEERDRLAKDVRDREADVLNKEADREEKKRKDAKEKAKKDAEDWAAFQKEFENDLAKQTKEGQENQDKQKKERQEKELKELTDFSKKVLDIASNEIAAKSKLRQDEFDKSIKDSEKNIETQRRLAERGLQNTLIEEEARKVQLERQKEEEKRAEIKRQKALAFFKLFSQYAERDPNTALAKALSETVIAEAIAGSFYTGTEGNKTLGDMLGRTGTKDGHLILADDNERIFNPDDTAKLGSLTNKEVADLAYKAQSGLLDTAKYGAIPNGSFSENAHNSALLMQTIALRKEVSEMKEAIINKPVTNFEFNQYGDFIKTQIENGFTKRTTYRQPKPRI